MAFTVAELARLVGGATEGETGRVIRGANALESAGPDDVAFAANKKALTKAGESKAGCLLAPEGIALETKAALIRVKDPRAAFAKALENLYPKKRPAAGVHATAIVAASARLGVNCSVAAYVTVGENCVIGEGCVLGAGCVIGDDVEIGAGSVLGPRVVIYERVKIGARAVIHAGCVIGADGFGFTMAGDHYEKFPQVGRVEIGDDVEMGANCCVDRAALGVTRIGDGTKLDNLIHVAHNCVIGKHVVIAAQTGFSGSVTTGDYAVIGGQAGIGEKAQIAARAVIGGKAGVLTSARVPAGEPMWGIPARPLRKHLKGLAYVEKLPELNERVREIRQRLEELESGGKKS